MRQSAHRACDQFTPGLPEDYAIPAAELVRLEEERLINHIRHHRQYQAVLCLGIAPDSVLIDAWRKGEASEGKAGRLVTMDRGSSATFKLTKKQSDLRPVFDFSERIGEIVAALG
ncbi:MAG: hypothetical protein OXP68_01355 [Anaerolineaceae bacterium]|nr:hypothetical protein [Anaerolineaceae bacterium]MDE0328699.1 hypothetical protein [Anaerolineaceae bacterium]